MSIGALYHYFPTKRDLLLHPLTQEVLDRFCFDFLKGSFELKTTDPRQFRDVYADLCAQTCLFVRPAAQAALELGAETFWPVMDGMHAERARQLPRGAASGRAGPHGRAGRLARAFDSQSAPGRPDRSMTADEIRAEVRALVDSALARPHADFVSKGDLGTALVSPG